MSEKYNPVNCEKCSHSCKPFWEGQNSDGSPRYRCSNCGCPPYYVSPLVNEPDTELSDFIEKQKRK